MCHEANLGTEMPVSAYKVTRQHLIDHGLNKWRASKIARNGMYKGKHVVHALFEAAFAEETFYAKLFRGGVKIHILKIKVTRE